MSTRSADPSAESTPFVTGAVPVPIEEDTTPLPVRIPLGRRPPPPPLVEGKLISLRSGSTLALKSLAKLRLLRIDELTDDNRWLMAPLPVPQAVPTHLPPEPAEPFVSPSIMALPSVPIVAAPTLPATSPLPTFRWQRRLPAQGSLAELSAVQLFGWAIATGFSGCLLLSSETNPGSRELPGRELFFDAGVLVGARSQLPGDELVELQGALWTQAQKKRAVEVLRKARGEGLRKQLELLVSAKLLDTKDFCQRQADFVVEIVCRALALRRGTFCLLDRALPAGEQTMLPLASRLLLTLAVRRGMDLATLATCVGPLSMVLVPVSLALPQAGGAVLQNMGLSSVEEEALLLFDGERSLHEISTSSGIGEHAVYGLGYCLLSLGAVSHLHHLSPEEQKRLESQRQARARARALNDAMTMIQKKARLCESADYFTLLGVAKSASPEEIRAAYQRERGAIAPSLLPYRSRSAMDRELRQIALVLDEAYAVLSDPVRRACYTPA